MGLYFHLKLIFSEPVMSIFFFVLAFDAIAFFAIMWDSAPLIPVMMEELKNQVDVVAAVGGGVRNRKYWRSVSRSVPCIGVSVGGFRSMERDSTLIFMDFVIRNVVSLLMAFK